MKIEELKSFPIVKIHLTKIESLTPEKIQECVDSFGEKVTVAVSYFDDSAVVRKGKMPNVLNNMRSEMKDQIDQGNCTNDYTTWYVDKFFAMNEAEKRNNLVHAAIEAYSATENPEANTVEHAVVKIEMEDTICFILTNNGYEEEISQEVFDQIWDAAHKSVTNIKGIFKDRTDLTSYIIPNSVTEIGWEAFDGCINLTSITIPDSVTKIDSFAFSQCTSLRDITVPRSVTEISKCSFNDCSSLHEIKVAEGNKVYDSRNNCNAIIITESNILLRGCSATVIPNSVTGIGEDAFYGSGVTSIDIPSSVAEIGESAFRNCSNLTSIAFSNIVKKICKYTFSGCRSLASFIIPDSVTTIEDWAFDKCSALENIVIPESVTELGNDYGEVFRGCTGLKSVLIEAKLKKLAAGMFDGCSSLESITLSAGIGSISKKAFEGCTALKAINVPAKKADYYKKRLPENLHSLIVELPAEKKK